MNSAHEFKPFLWKTETIASLFTANQLSKTQTRHLQEHKYCYVFLKYKRLGKYGVSGFTTAYLWILTLAFFFSCLFVNSNFVFFLLFLQKETINRFFRPNSKQQTTSALINAELRVNTKDISCFKWQFGLNLPDSLECPISIETENSVVPVSTNVVSEKHKTFSHLFPQGNECMLITS